MRPQGWTVQGKSVGVAHFFHVFHEGCLNSDEPWNRWEVCYTGMDEYHKWSGTRKLDESDSQNLHVHTNFTK